MSYQTVHGSETTEVFSPTSDIDDRIYTELNFREADEYVAPDDMDNTDPMYIESDRTNGEFPEYLNESAGYSVFCGTEETNGPEENIYDNI